MFYFYYVEGNYYDIFFLGNKDDIYGFRMKDFCLYLIFKNIFCCLYGKRFDF